MKLTNLEIFNAREPLNKLLSVKLPVKTSYGLAKLAAKLNDQLGIIEQVRKGLFETYGEPNPENPTQIRLNPESATFSKAMSELGVLMAQETEIVFDVVTLPDTLEVEPAVLMALEKFIKL